MMQAETARPSERMLSRGNEPCPVCPEWTERCAHWDDQTVRIDKRVALPDHMRLRLSFAVLGPNASQQCTCGRHTIVGTMFSQLDTNSRDEADAEFDRREAAMLARDA